MKKNKLIMIVAGAVTGGLVAVGTAAAIGSEPSWQDEVRASVQADWNASTDADNAEGCAALSMFGLTTPEAMADFIMPLAGEMTPEDYAELGIPLGSDALDGVETREIVLVAADEMITLCNFDGTPVPSKGTPSETPTATPADAKELVAEDSALTAQGVPVVAGDWQITVTGVQNVSDAEAASWAEWNEPAQYQYVAVEYEATYVGDSRTADIMSDLTWSVFDTDGTVYNDTMMFNQYDAEGVSTTVAPGGTVEYVAVFDLPATANGYASVEAGWETGEYADFAM